MTILCSAQKKSAGATRQTFTRIEQCNARYGEPGLSHLAQVNATTANSCQLASTATLLLVKVAPHAFTTTVKELLSRSGWVLDFQLKLFHKLFRRKRVYEEYFGMSRSEYKKELQRTSRNESVGPDNNMRRIP